MLINRLICDMFILSLSTIVTLTTSQNVVESFGTYTGWCICLATFLSCVCIAKYDELEIHIAHVCIIDAAVTKHCCFKYAIIPGIQTDMKNERSPFSKMMKKIVKKHFF